MAFFLFWGMNQETCEWCGLLKASRSNRSTCEMWQGPDANRCVWHKQAHFGVEHDRTKMVGISKLLIVIILDTFGTLKQLQYIIRCLPMIT